MNDRQTGNVVIYLKEERIEGHIYIRKECIRGRISDALNKAKGKFIPIMDARVYKLNSNTPQIIVKTLFVNKDHIIYVQPSVEVKKSE